MTNFWSKKMDEIWVCSTPPYSTFEKFRWVSDCDFLPKKKGETLNFDLKPLISISECFSTSRFFMSESQEWSINGFLVSKLMDFTGGSLIYLCGIFTDVHHKNMPNVGKYTSHGWYGLWNPSFCWSSLSTINPTDPRRQLLVGVRGSLEDIPPKKRATPIFFGGQGKWIDIYIYI